MKEVVILQDPNGLSMRVVAMRDAHPNVVAVAPSSRSVGHCLVSDAPDHWLPNRKDVPEHKREWFKCDAMSLAAVVNHGIEADYYWFIESDVASTQERWTSFFKEFENRTDDCLCLEKLHRGNTRPERWQGLPQEADTAFLMCLYRLSRRMVDRSIAMAEDLRNVFCEVSVPWVAQSAGWNISTLAMGGHYNSSTIGPLPRSIKVDPKLINHPVKSNTYGP